MSQKERQSTVFASKVEILDQVPSNRGNSSGGALEPNTGVALTFDRVRYVRHARLTLTAFSIAVTAALDYGGTKICDLPDSNMLILGVEADLTIVKGGVTNGIVAATDLKVGIGTAAAAAIPIATTAVDVIEATDLTTDALSVTFKKHTNDQSSPAIVFSDDSATAALYLNASATGGITADDALTVSGTIDLYYIDVGNVTS